MYHPGIAAQLLWNGLNQCLAYYHIRRHIDDDDLASLIQARQAVAQQACNVGIAASEIYLAAVGVASDGVDLIMTINEVAEGNYVAIAGALPFIPTSLFGSFRKILIRNQSGQIIDSINSAQQLTALQDLYRIADPQERLRVMGVTMEQNQFKMAILRVLRSDAGPVPVPTNRGLLRDRMEALTPKPSFYVEAHHDFPWEFAKEFATHGIDVNNAAFGRWATTTDHYQWHNRMTPKFNDYWEDFWQQEAQFGPYTKQTILNKLAECRSIFTLNNGN
jgi:hypothetical protein